METLVVVGVLGALVFSVSFRNSVKRTLHNAADTLEVANDAWESGLNEVRNALPKADDVRAK